MAELQYQNPNAGNVTAQLESELSGVAADGVTEVRRELIEARATNEVLQDILQELRQIKLMFIEEFK